MLSDTDDTDDADVKEVDHHGRIERASSTVSTSGRPGLKAHRSIGSTSMSKSVDFGQLRSVDVESFIARPDIARQALHLMASKSTTPPPTTSMLTLSA